MKRIEKLESRRIDAMLRTPMLNEVYKTIRQSESVRYAIGAMQPIDTEYTKHTFAQGERVKSQMEQRVATTCDYEFQGSVTTGTHIKARSDVDLLAIRKGWMWVEPPQVPSSPYQGDPVGDMRLLRAQVAESAERAFPAVNVDRSHGKCIRLTGGSLTRDVDVVPASWHHTNDFARTGDAAYRGVKVFNDGTGKFSANTPRLLKRRIEERDQATRGGLRKAARLMKTLKYDSDDRVAMSSYNVVAIAFNIPESDLVPVQFRDLAILEACFRFCNRLLAESDLRTRIVVPDSHRAVFGEGQGATSAELAALVKELADLRRDIFNENMGHFSRLDDVSIPYSVAASA